MTIRLKYAAALGCLVCLLGGCSEMLPLAQLPDVTKLPQKLLDKNEQQGKADEMSETAQARQIEAVKRIEQAK